MCINYKLSSESIEHFVSNEHCLILHLLSLNFVNVEIELKSTKKECYFEKKYYKMVDCIRKYFQCLRSLGKKEMFLFIKYTINFRPKKHKTTFNVTNTISHLLKL